MLLNQPERVPHVLCVCVCEIMCSSHCLSVHTGSHASIRVICTCVDTSGGGISPVSKLLSNNYLGVWIPTKTTPTCRQASVSIYKGQICGRLKEVVGHYLCQEPGESWLSSNRIHGKAAGTDAVHFDSGNWRFADRRCRMYVVMMHD